MSCNKASSSKRKGKGRCVQPPRLLVHGKGETELVPYNFKCIVDITDAHLSPDPVMDFPPDMHRHLPVGCGLAYLTLGVDYFLEKRWACEYVGAGSRRRLFGPAWKGFLTDLTVEKDDQVVFMINNNDEPDQCLVWLIAKLVKCGASVPPVLVAKEGGTEFGYKRSHEFKLVCPAWKLEDKLEDID